MSAYCNDNIYRYQNKKVDVVYKFLDQRYQLENVPRTVIKIVRDNNMIFLKNV